MDATDAALLQRWQVKRDGLAFNELLSRHSGMVYGTCRRILGEVPEAEEVTQDCFVTLTSASPDVGGYLGAWLHRVAVRRALNNLKSRQRRAQREHHFWEQKESSDTGAARPRLMAQVDEAIDALPERLRRPIVLHFLDGLTQDAVAQTLDLPRTTVVSRIQRGIDSIRQHLDRRGHSLTVATLAALLGSELRASVPAVLAARLGRIALAGEAPVKAAATAGGLATAAKIAIAGFVVAIAAGAVYHKLRPVPSESSPAAAVAQETRAPAASNAPVQVVAAKPAVPSAPAPLAGAPVAVTNEVAKDAARYLQVSVVDANTDVPIAGAILTYKDKPYTADTQGKALLPLQFDKVGATFYGRADTYTPRRVSWSTSDPAQIPEAYVLKMQKGITIGGKVVDPDGQPVAGATVFVLGTGSDMASDLRVFEDKPFVWDEPAVTDAQGVWTYHKYPADRNRVSLRLQHPDYICDEMYKEYQNMASLQAQSFEIQMQRGFALQGVVVDPQGQPVINAFVFQGQDRWGSHYPETKTDAQGQFSFPHVKAGQMVLTVVKPGFAPELLKTDPASNETVRFNLKLGHRVDLTVLDSAGNPVSGVHVLPDTWRYRTLADIKSANAGVARELRFHDYTDDSGHFVWEWAPEDKVRYGLVKAGWSSLRDVVLSAVESSKTVTLYPKLSIAGRVTDKATGLDIASFRVLNAHATNAESNPRFVTDYPVEGKGGRYAVTFDDAVAFYWVKIEAKGYASVASRPVAITDGKTTLDFQLEPVHLLTTTITTPDGRPLPGIAVYLLEADKPHGASGIENGLLRVPASRPAETSDGNGRVTFNPPESASVVVVCADAGFGFLTDAELRHGNTLTVEPWAEIEAEVLSGTTPEPNADIRLSVALSDPVFERVCYFSYRTQTGPDGKARFTRVLPHRVYASLSPQKGPTAAKPAASERQEFELQPGEKKSIRFTR